MTALPVEKTVISDPLFDAVYEVIGNLDGQPIFLGRMVRNPVRGGFSASTDRYWWPRSWKDGVWKPTEERAIRWMQEHKGL